MANSTNKTWLSSNDPQKEDGKRKLCETSSVPITSSSSASGLDGELTKGRRLDDSEVVVLSPMLDRHSPVDIYEQSRHQWKLKHFLSSCFIGSIQSNNACYFKSPTDLNISHISVVAVGDETNWNDSRNNVSAVMVQPSQGMVSHNKNVQQS